LPYCHAFAIDEFRRQKTLSPPLISFRRHYWPG
jgi:hypothetical protein